MELSEEFFKEETRNDYLITSKQKKVWATQLNMLELVDDICQRHGIRYFVDWGTLLGAVRHQGFIPWDDDIDISMFRDDYERFKQVAMEEIREPYCFQNVYTQTGMIWAFSKIRDSRTSAIEFPDIPAEKMNQGIFLDIFPLDDAPDGVNMKAAVGEIQRELWATVIQPKLVAEAIRQKQKFTLETDILVDMLSLSVQERMQEFETFNARLFGKSTKVNFITDQICKISPAKERKWYDTIIYLPFENIKVPAPAGYDEILKCLYGDYSKFVIGKSDHNLKVLDPDTPYHFYLEKQSKS